MSEVLKLRRLKYCIYNLDDGTVTDLLKIAKTDLWTKFSKSIKGKTNLQDRSRVLTLSTRNKKPPISALGKLQLQLPQLLENMSILYFG